MSSFDKIRAVFDCNAYFQAVVRKDSPASSCYKLAEDGIVELFVSEDVLAELKDVLSRPKIRQKIAALTDERVEEFLTSLSKTAKMIIKVPKVFSLSRDVDDETYINLAVKAEADYIVTRDKDLIDLMSGYDIESKLFRQKFRFLKVVQPLEFLQIVEDKIKERTTLKP